MRKYLQKAFTIVEILVVVVILGIISALVLLAINPAKKINLSKDARVKSDVSQIVNSLQTYYANPLSDAKYPSTPDGLDTLIQSGELKSLPNQQEGFNPCPVTPGGITTGTTYCYVVSEETEDKVIAVWGTLFSKGLLAWCWDSVTGTFTEKKEGEALPTAENPSCQIALPTSTPTSTPAVNTPTPTITPTPRQAPEFRGGGTTSPGTVGIPMTFNAYWTDANGDPIRMHVCKTNVISGQTCTGGSWCDSASFTSISPTTCLYTPVVADVSANQSDRRYFNIFVCDDKNNCSYPSTELYFQVLPATCSKSDDFQFGLTSYYTYPSNPPLSYLPVNTGAEIQGYVFGLLSCSGKTTQIRQGSCTGALVASCIVEGSGFTAYSACTFNAPATPGNYTYCAFVDLNSNGSYGAGEYYATYLARVGLFPGAECTTNSQCGSGYCYEDIDGDVYASTSPTYKMCQEIAPLGSDCYDYNSDAHPGQTFYYGVNRGDGSFDYNCDGVQTKFGLSNLPAPETCAAGSPSSSIRGGWVGTQPACGECAENFRYCVVTYGNSTCSQNGASGPYPWCGSSAFRLSEIYCSYAMDSIPAQSYSSYATYAQQMCH